MTSRPSPDRRVRRWSPAAHRVIPPDQAPTRRPVPAPYPSHGTGTVQTASPALHRLPCCPRDGPACRGHTRGHQRHRVHRGKRGEVRAASMRTASPSSPILRSTRSPLPAAAPCRSPWSPRAGTIADAALATYTYLTVSALSPDSGPAAGGTPVTIVGSRAWTGPGGLLRRRPGDRRDRGVAHGDHRHRARGHRDGASHRAHRRRWRVGSRRPHFQLRHAGFLGFIAGTRRRSRRGRCRVGRGGAHHPGPAQRAGDGPAAAGQAVGKFDRRQGREKMWNQADRS